MDWDIRLLALCLVLDLGAVYGRKQVATDALVDMERAMPEAERAIRHVVAPRRALREDAGQHPHQ